MKKIIIAGAGLSGLSAAITFANAGYEVEVYEKNKRVGERFHGDFQGIENWTSEEDILEIIKKMNIKIDFPVYPSKKFTMYDSSLEYEHIKSDKPFCYLVRRGHFKDTIDYGFYKQAKKAGVKIVFNKKIDNDSADIIATGPKHCDMIAKGISFKTNITDCIKILVDKRAAPQAYAYMIVNKSRGIIVSCAATHFKDINSVFDYTLSEFKKIKKFDIKNKKEFAGYISFFLQDPEKHDKKLFVGEAAGFQDYLFGFGMRYAILSGCLAAKSIIENKDYDELWRNEFGEQLEMGVANRFIYEHFTNIEVKALEMFSNIFDARTALRELYKPTLLKRIILPIVKKIMKSRRKCRRGCSCTWCREKSQQVD